MLCYREVDIPEHVGEAQITHHRHGTTGPDATPDDLGYFDDEMGRLEPIANPFGPKVLPMCSE